VIAVRGLAKRYGDKRILRGLDFELERDGLLLVTGPNGSGKTTLLRILAGLAAPSGGEVLVDARREELGFLAHEPLVYRELTALENLRLYARLYRVRDAERVGMLLERFGLWDARNERVASFSRGMQQRLALCRVLIHQPSLLLLDEPYNALDSEGASLLDGVFAASGATCVVAAHDAHRIEPHATQRLALA
jgi:heme exporter protein A